MTLLVAALLAAAAQDVPTLTRRVNDLAGVMAGDDLNALDQRLAELEQSDGTQVVLLTIATTDGRAIEEYALAVGRANGIGQKGTNSGILIVMAVQDRKCRIEVGYGLEGRVPDTTAALIIQREMVPRFRKGDYSGGARAGTEAIVRAVRGEYKAPPAAARPPRSKSGFGMTVLVVVAIIAVILRGPRRRRYGGWGYFGGVYSTGWGGGRSGSGGGGYRSSGFSGGGGSFGGGGASGSW